MSSTITLFSKTELISITFSHIIIGQKPKYETKPE